eukprot:1277727-Pleurochrysis_carterae.AAC.3
MSVSRGVGVGMAVGAGEGVGEGVHAGICVNVRMRSRAQVSGRLQRAPGGGASRERGVPSREQLRLHRR